MKLILVGMGSFGSIWYKTLKNNYNDMQIIIVDSDEASKVNISDSSDHFYTCLTEAIEKENPDFILNVTPPGIHPQINNIAFDYKLPVLCEKPIAEDYNDALNSVRRSKTENLSLVIAENYRREPVMRKLKELIVENKIGDIKSIHVDLYKKLYFEDKQKYVYYIKNPLLSDVSIHHFDLIRYFTGSEGKSVFARAYNPKGSWFNGNANLDVLLEMENGIMVSYTGSLVAENKQTDWKGSWRFEGTEGTITLDNDKINIIKGEEIAEIKDFSDIISISCLDEFLLTLKEKKYSETCAAEYIKTQALVHFSEKSCKENKMVEISIDI